MDCSKTASRPLNICLYTTRALPKRGGQELAVDALARGFIALGQNVVVLAARTGHIHQADSGLPYQIVRHPRFVSTRWFVSWYRWFLLQLHESNRFDIVHCHGVYPAGYLGALCRKRLGIPLVLTNHSGNLESDATWIRKPSLRSRYVFAFSSADVLIAISRQTAEIARRIAPDHGNIATIPNGVDLESLDTPIPLPDDRLPGIVPAKYILVLARLRHSKGIDLLIKALAALRGVDDFSLVIGGSGQEQERLSELVSQLKLHNRVLFPGWVSGSIKTSLLQNALCSVVPSREAEGFGLVALESFAAGRPVIASRVPGLSELISDGHTGLLFEPDSVDSLAEALRALIADRALANRLGSKGKLFAQSYRWRDIADKHLRLYRSLCSSRGTSSKNSAGDHHASLAHS